MLRSSTILAATCGVCAVSSALIASSVQSSSTKLTCTSIPGSERIIEMPQRYVIFGEIHGTSETPALFGDLVCAAAQKGAVLVALEFDEKSTPSLQQFMSSDGATADVRTLLRDPAWSKDLADGRNSLAMLSLLEHLRRLRVSGAKVQVYATQARVAAGLDQNYSELAMASQWARLATVNPEATVFVLVGNIHALLAQPPGLPFRPAASHLPEKDVLSFRPEFGGGEAWNCQSDGCGAHKIEKQVTKPRFVGLLGESGGSYNATYSVGRPFTASAPAIGEEPR